MSDKPQCPRCGVRHGGYGNCTMSPPCKPHPLGPRCKKCGAPDFAGAICPERPTIQANVGGHGWRRVPNKVSDCISQDKAGEDLAELIRGAYARHRRKRAHDAGASDPATHHGIIEPEYLT